MQSRTSDCEYLPGLHWLRAMAVMLVLVYHFVLSGFLITRLLLLEHWREGRVSVSTFYARRTLRIFPEFYCYWLLVGGLLLLSGKTVPWAERLCHAPASEVPG